MLNKTYLYIIPLLALVLSACTTNIHPSTETNPPPTEKFSAFNRFELAPLQAANNTVSDQEAAMKKIEEHIQGLLGVRLQSINNKETDGDTRTLLIEPIITELKFVSGLKRAFTGAYSGSSAVILKAKFSEKETGKVIASPEFYSKASAMSGAYSVGGNDNKMLHRIANWFTVYFLNNYKQAIGGNVVSEDIQATSISIE